MKQYSKPMCEFEEIIEEDVIMSSGYTLPEDPLDESASESTPANATQESTTIADRKDLLNITRYY